MITLPGKYTTAKIMIDNIEQTCMSQIIQFINHPAFTNPVAIMPDTHFGKGSVIGFTMPLGEKVIPNVIGVDIGCFIEETKVPVLDGIEYSFKELVNMGEFYVYSMNEDLKIVPGKARALKTRENSELVEVAISGGDRLVCTPDQKFMLLDGSYKEAKDLQPRESLMPFYRSYCSRDGYEFIHSYRQKTITTHELVSSFFLGKRKKNEVVHHKNEKWYDNTPTNLEFLNKKLHSSLTAKSRNYMATKEFKKKRELKFEEKRFFFDPKFLKKKQEVATENIKSYMENNQEKWLEKIKDNGKRGSSYFRIYNEKINNMVFSCDLCGRQVKGKGGFTKHLNSCKSKQTNHKVLYVKNLDYKKDVYCLQVEEFNNFAISGGVFVHNCGMLSVNLGKQSLNYQEIDDKIRENIPFGINIHSRGIFHMKNDFPWESVNKRAVSLFKRFNTDAEYTYTYDWFEKKCKEIKVDVAYAISSIGSLGGGNHFIELGTSEATGETWLTVHSGSRNFGKRVCDYWQEKAENIHKEKRNNFFIQAVEEIKKTTDNRKEIGIRIEEARREAGIGIGVSIKELEWLENSRAVDYLLDMLFAQVYAEVNRQIIVDKIIEVGSFEILDRIETVHNFVDFRDFIIRKGAIRSYVGEKMIIPFNMRDGILVCEGKSNPEWNFSAPHGAGRLMSRSKAKATINLSEFEDQMEGIFSTSVGISTLDEAPDAYKDPKVIEEAIQPTAIVIDRIKPIHNMKDKGDRKPWKKKGKNNVETYDVGSD